MKILLSCLVHSVFSSLYTETNTQMITWSHIWLVDLKACTIINCISKRSRITRTIIIRAPFYSSGGFIASLFMAFPYVWGAPRWLRSGRSSWAAEDYCFPFRVLGAWGRTSGWTYCLTELAFHVFPSVRNDLKGLRDIIPVYLSF